MFEMLKWRTFHTDLSVSQFEILFKPVYDDLYTFSDSSEKYRRFSKAQRGKFKLYFHRPSLMKTLYTSIFVGKYKFRNGAVVLRGRFINSFTLYIVLLFPVIFSYFPYIYDGTFLSKLLSGNIFSIHPLLLAWMIFGWIGGVFMLIFLELYCRDWICITLDSIREILGDHLLEE